MKKLFVAVFAVVMLFASAEFSFGEHPEKQKNDSHFVVASKAASVSGALTSGSPVFNRPIAGSVVDPTCSGTGFVLSESGNAVHYSVHEIYSPTGENLVASVTSGSDSYLVLYCNPFDPLDPLANLRFADDDDGDGLNGAFLPGDNVYLEPNTSYFLVVTSFSNSATFSYDLDVEGGVVFREPEPAAVPLSLLSLGLAVLLIGFGSLFLIRW